MKDEYKYLDLLTALLSSIAIISGTIAGKIFQLGPVTLPGSAVIFPLTYIFGDILTEVYGYQRARRVIWIALLCSVIGSIAYGTVAELPPAKEFQNNQAYKAVLGQVPRIAAAGWIAFFLGEISNSVTLSLMKIWTKGRYLWTRTISSTIIGELVDTAIFFTLAFVGILPWSLITKTIFYLYVWKVLVEVLFTPITYVVVAHLKKVDQTDVYDHGISYSPFRFETSGEKDAGTS